MDRTINSNSLKQPQQLKVLQKRKTALLLSSCLILAIPACSTLPKQGPEPTQYAFDTDTSHTELAQIVTPLKEKNPDLTGFHVLYDPLEALAARIHLIEKAQKTLDLQYYIWDNDKIGSLALYKMIEAADRAFELDATDEEDCNLTVVFSQPVEC